MSKQEIVGDTCAPSLIVINMTIDKLDTEVSLIIKLPEAIQARSKLKWSGRAKHCMAQLKACVSTVLLGRTGGTLPRKMYKFDALKSLLRPSGSKNRTVAETT